MSAIEQCNTDTSVSVRVVLSTDHVESFAETVATAFQKFQTDVSKATKSQAETVLEACADIRKALEGQVPFTASDYERTLGKALKAELAVRVKRGKLEASTASKKGSNMKAVALAVISGALTPEDGEGFASMYERSVKALASPAYAYVYGEAPKAGAPAGTVSQRKGSGRRGGASGPPTASPAVPGGTVSGTNKSGPAAREENLRNAALALGMGDRERSERFYVVATKFAKEFDAWASTIIATAK